MAEHEWLTMKYLRYCVGCGMRQRWHDYSSQWFPTLFNTMCPRDTIDALAADNPPSLRSRLLSQESP